MNRNLFEAFVTEYYSINAEHPFSGDQTIAVFRHRENRKWFCVVMTIPKKTLGIDTDGSVDIVNLKCAPEMLDTLWQERGIFPAYHMHKGHWISALLDGSVTQQTLAYLLSISFDLTGIKKRKK